MASNPPARETLHVPLVSVTSAARKEALTPGMALAFEMKQRARADATSLHLLVPDGPRIGSLPTWLARLMMPHIGPSRFAAGVGKVQETEKASPRIWITINLGGAPVFDRDFVVVDLETTGLDPREDDILEIGAIRVRNDEVLAQYHSFVTPRRPIPPFITNLTGIDDSMVAGAPQPPEALRGLGDFVQDVPLIAHNAQFDLGFLQAGLDRWKLPPLSNTVLCTLTIARLLRPEIPHSLGQLARALLVEPKDQHRALGDVQTTHQIFQRLLATQLPTESTVGGADWRTRHRWEREARAAVRIS